MTRIYQGIKNDKFAVTLDGLVIRQNGAPLTFNRLSQAQDEAIRRISLAAQGFMPRGHYGYVSLAECKESRPVNLYVSGNGF